MKLQLLRWWWEYEHAEAGSNYSESLSGIETDSTPTDMGNGKDGSNYSESLSGIETHKKENDCETEGVLITLNPYQGLKHAVQGSF